MRQILFIGLLFVGLSNLSFAQPMTSDFSGFYASLKSEQKALVDDWVQRFNATVSKRVEPHELYDKLPVSIRTTFNAVTHALISTRLADSSGGDLGTALQIIAKLHTVKGEILGTRGDEQFRIYVQLTPDAIDVLERSQQFRKKDDNITYHQGYPICFRSLPSVPSIQVSASRDRALADIDVDYRSSGFPKALLNGHLSASNSDVRAGQNDEIHNSQWSGLNNWWRSILSLPPRPREADVYAEAGKTATKLSPKAKGKPAEAVNDLLSTWLVEGRPENVLSYFAQETTACAELESGESQDRGMARIKLLMALRRANERLGEVAQLSDVSTAVQPAGTISRAKLVRQPYEGQFSLYDVREDAAEQFLCLNRLDPTLTRSKAANSKSFGKYYGAVFRLGNKNLQPSVTLATLWTRGPSGYWRLVSYDVDPEWETYRAPNTGPTPPPASNAHTDAPSELTRRVEDFLGAWLVMHTLDEAVSYLSNKANRCAVDDTVPKPDYGSQDLVRAAMQRVIDSVGLVRDLSEAVVAAPVNHEDIKLVKQARDRTYALAAIPEYMGDSLDCAVRTGNEPRTNQPHAGAKNYGKYYAMGFKLKKAGEDTAVLWTVWAQEGQVWKLSSYTVLTP